MFEVEIALYLLEQLGNIPVSLLPQVLQWHLPPASQKQRRMIASACAEIGSFRRSQWWKHALSQYRALREDVRGYSIVLTNASSSGELDETGQGETSTRSGREMARRLYPSVCIKRFDVYSRTLLLPAPVDPKPPRPFAPAGAYTFRTSGPGGREHIHTVGISEQVLSQVSQTVNRHQVRPDATNPPLAITFDELRRAAKWMDQRESEAQVPALGNWEARFDNLLLQVFNPQNKLVPSELLPISRIFHLVGIVGTGKSTLTDILAVAIALRGHHVTLLLGDVMSQLDKARQFNVFRSGWAAPILGKRSRYDHLSKLVGAMADECGPTSSTAPWRASHPGFRWASLACPLLGMRDRGEADQWVEPREYPCENLRSADTAIETRIFACPLFNVCPYHAADRDLTTAAIWLATPESLLYTTAPDLLAPDSFPTDSPPFYARLAYHRSSLLIVDEADAIQIRLDQIFSPTLPIQDWFLEIKEANDRLANQRRFDLQDEDSVVQNSAVSEMSKLLPQMLRLTRRLGPGLRRRSYFSDLTLFQELAIELCGGRPGDEAVISHPDYQRLRELFDQFIDHPQVTSGLRSKIRNQRALRADLLRKYGETGEGAQLVAEDAPTTSFERALDELLALVEVGDPVDQLREAAVLLSDGLPQNEKRGVEALRTWLERYSNSEYWKAAGHKDLVVDRLRFAILVTLTQAVFNRLRYSPVSPFLGPPLYYQNLVPASPIGNVIAFWRYDDTPGPEEPARLQVIDCHGIGRALMLNFHRLFARDDCEGPHVLLLSGTSWAGTSGDYHVQCPVGGILLAKQNDELLAIGCSTLRFEPIVDELRRPLTISGIGDADERQHAVERMARLMGQTGGLLEREIRDINQLREASLAEWNDRGRVLLFTGSYTDAESVQKGLWSNGRWQSQAGKYPVARMISDDRPDVGPETVRRGRVARIVDVVPGIEALAAPLSSVGRAHNILNVHNKAAFGSGIFMVRPHPSPDDVSYIIRAINYSGIEALARFERIGVPAAANEWGRFRGEVSGRWRRLSRSPIIYSYAADPDRDSLTWSLLVQTMQAFGRLIRGGVPARIIFCDAKYLPVSAGIANRVGALTETAPQSAPADTAKTSVLLGFRAILRPYLDPALSQTVPERDRAVVAAIYGPLFPLIEALMRDLPRLNA